MRRHAAELDDQLCAEGAYRGELEPDVSLIGKSGVAGDVRVDLLAPGSQLHVCDRPVERGGHDLGHQPVDLWASAVDNRAQDRLRAWNVRERAAQRRKEAGTCLLARL